MRSALLLAGITLFVMVGVRAEAQTRKKAKGDPNDLASYDARITPEDRAHWAFRPPRRPPVPTVHAADWVRTPIDAFVLARLEEAGLRPAPAAAPRALVRRLHFGVIGLPPTPAEVATFERDAAVAPDRALRHAVDRLLASPHYGERWARHWLDLVRYAETNGYERDATRPFVWRYRDYVIRAFNADKRYDRFILEQLAGDELPDATGETLIATGYYRLGPWDDEPADPQEDRFDQLDDLIGTTSQVFLGLTLACARCHDHKFEPLTMHDYYRLAAVFRGLQRPTQGRTELTLPAGTARDRQRRADRDRALAALNRTALALRVSAPTAPAAPLLDALQSGLRADIPDLPRGYFLHEASPKPPATHLLQRGKAARPGPEVKPGVPAVLVARQPPFLPPDARTSRRRLTLARWIAAPENPLTARVIVNRVWHYHFGAGLVRSPSDFGSAGRAPTHPELLDWLAVWFVEHGWSLKELHRLILTSATYQMSQRADDRALAQDPDNRLLARFPRRRLEAEALCDAVLAVSGQLDRRLYGPAVYPFIPREALAGSSDPRTIWKPFDERAAARRAIYAFRKRAMSVPLLEVLDVCDSSRSCDRRLVTTVAPQALSLFNGDLVNRQARHFAERLSREAGADPSRQIEEAYQLALGRAPTAAERSTLLAFLRREAAAQQREGAAAAVAQRRALEQVCRVIFNLNEFAYPD